MGNPIGIFKRPGCQMRLASMIWMFAFVETMLYYHTVSLESVSLADPFRIGISHEAGVRLTSSQLESAHYVSTAIAYSSCDTLVQKRSNQLICSMMHTLWDSFEPPANPAENSIHRVIPNIVQRDSSTSQDDMLVLATHLGIAKLQTLLVQARWWGGPVSAAIYLSSPEEINILVNFIEQHEFSLRDTSLHVMLDKTDLPYPHNILRNLAMDYLDGEFFVAADVDFIPTPDCHAKLTELFGKNERLPQKLRKKTVMVLAAFERHMPSPNREVSEDLLPRSKAEVIEMVKSGNGNGFHMAGSTLGHGPTNYPKWMENKTNDYYSIPYKNVFEPYILGYKRGMPRYWQDFRGYGFNKFSWFFEIHKAGYEFAVLRDFYVVHMNHPIPDLKKKSDFTDWNRAHWRKFKDYLSKRYPKKPVNK